MLEKSRGSRVECFLQFGSEFVHLPEYNTSELLVFEGVYMV
jgi:hypothetical protein